MPWQRGTPVRTSHPSSRHPLPSHYPQQVREIQQRANQNPGDTPTVPDGWTYQVTRPIEVGQSVTAYHKKQKLLQRGQVRHSLALRTPPSPRRAVLTPSSRRPHALPAPSSQVLTADYDTHKYRVQFDRAELGTYTVRDYDLVTHGLPKVLVPRAGREYGANPTWDDRDVVDGLYTGEVPWPSPSPSPSPSPRL